MGTRGYQPDFPCGNNGQSLRYRIRVRRMADVSKIECIDLFGGIGGFRKGLSMADPRFEFNYYADIDKFACAVYNHNFHETWKPTDIRSVRADDIPDHRLLCAGNPCQGFSRAGFQRGFDDPRGQLFFEVERIIRAKQPEYIFLENVAGLLSNDRGRTFAKVIDTLRDCGYVGSWCCINSAAFLPQTRKRVYIVARLGDEPSRALLPFADSNGEPYPPCRETPGERERLWDYPTNTLQSRDGKGGAMQYVVQPKPGTDPRPTSHRPTKFTLTSTGTHTTLIADDGEYIVRRLTPLEYERLQGFPDNWTQFGEFPNGTRAISKTRRYQLVGNSVTVPVITAIGNEIAKEM